MIQFNIILQVPVRHTGVQASLGRSRSGERRLAQLMEVGANLFFFFKKNVISLYVAIKFVCLYYIVSLIFFVVFQGRDVNDRVREDAERLQHLATQLGHATRQCEYALYDSDTAPTEVSPVLHDIRLFLRRLLEETRPDPPQDPHPGEVPATPPYRPSCSVCLIMIPNRVLMCGHVLCGACLLRVYLCPVCREPITSVIQMYI